MWIVPVVCYLNHGHKLVNPYEVDIDMNGPKNTGQNSQTYAFTD